MQMAAALAEVPGVRSASVSQTLPMRGGGYNMPISIEGRPDMQGMSTEYRVVTPGYLEAMGVARQSGRLIVNTDRRETERVVVINDALAKTFFSGVDPIGREIGDGGGLTARVIGVVSSVAERRLDDPPQPTRYVALAQMPWVDAAQSFVIRTLPNVESTRLTDATRRTIAAVAPNTAVQEVTTMQRIHDIAVGPVRPILGLLSLLTGLALTLGAIGIYGVLAHFAVRHRRDWAIRTALGLSRGYVVAHVLRYGAVLVGAGIATGLLVTVGLTRLLSQLLYGVRSLDPLALGVAAVALFVVGLLAALIPAWRAGTTDPATVLREQ